VRLESVTGKNAFFDQVGSVTAVLKTSRHSDTPQIDTPHARRRVSLGDYEFADLIDQQDKVRLLIDPTSSYAQAAAMAMGRAMDDVIIGRCTRYSFHRRKLVVHLLFFLLDRKLYMEVLDYQLLNYYLQKQILDLGSVDPSIPRYIIVSPKQISDLLNITEVTSFRFSTQSKHWLKVKSTRS
jgi:hypothetical protein